MNTIKIWNDTPSERQLTDIAAALREGHLAVIPTDTCYAIAANALDVKAVDRVCRLKGINPEKSNLSILCSDISMASEYARIDNKGFRLLRDNTPGAFTFLFRTAGTLPRAFKGRKVVGVRIPACNVARKIAGILGNPLIVTSIEYADEDYAINPELIAEAYYDRAELMVEGGQGSTDVSTIVDCTSDTPTVTRAGKSPIDL